MASPRDLRPGDLLVVDDNRVNRLFLGRPLEQLGHTVRFAENGREALEALQPNTTPTYRCRHHVCVAVSELG